MTELVRRKAKGIFNVEIEEEDQILVRAAREGRMTIIIGLLSTNMVNINLRSNIDPHIDDDRVLDDYKATPLLEAAKNGHTDILRILLDKGAKPNIEYVARGRQIAALGLPRENVRPLTVAPSEERARSSRMTCSRGNQGAC